MRKLKNLPQNSRLVAILFGVVGGAIDVYCHLELHSLVALQTGNLILLANNLSVAEYLDSFYKLLSISCFTLGFLSSMVYRKYAKTSYWRSYAILPLLVVSFLLPLLPQVLAFKIAVLAYTTGIVLFAFSSMQIESEPFTVMMTSGNFQKLLRAWYDVWNADENKAQFKRKAMNYTLVVTSFIVGIFLSSLAHSFFGMRAIWLVTLCLICILFFYTTEIRLYHLEKSDM